MMDISKVRSTKQISEVVELARVIWTDHYAPIIGQDQVDYMPGKFQSEKAIAAQLGDGYEYWDSQTTQAYMRMSGTGVFAGGAGEICGTVMCVV